MRTPPRPLKISQNNLTKKRQGNEEPFLDNMDSFEVNSEYIYDTEKIRRDIEINSPYNRGIAFHQLAQLTMLGFCCSVLHKYFHKKRFHINLNYSR